MRFRQYLSDETKNVHLEFQSYKNFLSPNLSETDQYILEVFNTKLDVEETQPLYDFSTKWEIDDITYRFHAKKIDDGHWLIGFDKNNDIEYAKLDFNRYVGDILTGVLESVKKLLQKYRVEILSFNAYKDNSWLVKFYDSKFLQRYVTRHFGFMLDERIEKSDRIVWTYREVK